MSAGPAAAHAALAGSNPADGAQISTAPDQVTLTFNQNIQSNFATLKVVDADGTQWGRSEPVVEGRDMSVDLDGLGEAGQYTVAFRVISEDGHPIDGTYNFQLTQANPGAASSASGTAPATTTGSSDTAQPADEDSGGFPAWILIAVAVVVIGGAVVFFLVPRNTKKS
ncbi:MAG: copper resistance protein CopC [Rhodococcus sp.]|uniref:copper resistance CopC family protein n=1 Tax=Rhodococcus sp. MEB032 TaxID=3040322 RepID=UPI00229BC8E9|nr:copper resistance CopC family protein [Rhodococcus sp. MEB032]MCY4670021.1 copper resistance protein CopC [Rhodococcus sp. (in: high G+C Gram-positive bacteria)]